MSSTPGQKFIKVPTFVYRVEIWVGMAISFDPIIGEDTYVRVTHQLLT